MAVMQMQRFSICAMKKERKAILERLQSLGVVEIDNSLVEDESLHTINTMDSRQVFEKNASLADHALEILDKYAPEKKSMLDSLAGKELVEKQVFEKAMADNQATMGIANELVALDKKIAEQNANALKLQTQIDALEPWLKLDVPMDFAGTEKTAVLIGSINSVMTLEEILTHIGTHAPELEAVDIQVISTDRDQTCIAATCLKGQAVLLEETLRAIGFSRPAQVVRKTPAEQKAEYEKQIKEMERASESTEAQIKDYASSREDLKLISDYFRTRAQKYEVLGQVLHTRQTFLISGYLPKSMGQAIKTEFEEKYHASVDIEEVAEDEEAPVILKNGTISSAAEGVLQSYGLPKKGEVDPTKVMSFFYIIFFGMMLSDTAYGLLVFIVCAIALKKFPRMSAGLRTNVKLFMFGGISTAVWGVLFGGYFGDVVDVVAKTFFGYTGATPIIKPLWFAPLENPMKLLVFAMALGMIHLYAGLGMKGYMCLKNKDIVGFISDVVSWYMMITGLVLIFIPTEIFASIAQAHIVFPPVINTLAKVLAIGGALIILFMSGRDNKNPGLRIALGAYDLYNITGWLSDVLSYSRLLALGLATGVIASVVNQMGSMGGSGIFGIIVFILVFVVGHVLNMAINLLGTYVHTNRLQFVEFFGKFYEGGGKPFEPFQANTKYVDIKEEK